MHDVAELMSKAETLRDTMGPDIMEGDQELKKLYDMSYGRYEQLGKEAINIVLCGEPGSGKSKRINHEAYPKGGSLKPLYSGKGIGHRTAVLHTLRHAKTFDVWFERPQQQPCNRQSAGKPPLSREPSRRKPQLSREPSGRQAQQHGDAGQFVVMATAEAPQPRGIDKTELPKRLNISQAFQRFPGQRPGKTELSSEPISERKQVKFVHALTRDLGNGALDPTIGAFYVLHIQAPWIDLPSNVTLWDTPGWDGHKHDAMIRYALSQAQVIAPHTATRNALPELERLLKLDPITDPFAPPVLWLVATASCDEVMTTRAISKERKNYLDEVPRLQNDVDVLRSVRETDLRADVFDFLTSTLLLSLHVSVDDPDLNDSDDDDDDDDMDEGSRGNSGHGGLATQCPTRFLQQQRLLDQLKLRSDFKRIGYIMFSACVFFSRIKKLVEGLSGKWTTEKWEVSFIHHDSSSPPCTYCRPLSPLPFCPISQSPPDNIGLLNHFCTGVLRNHCHIAPARLLFLLLSLENMQAVGDGLQRTPPPSGRDRKNTTRQPSSVFWFPV